MNYKREITKLNNDQDVKEFIFNTLPTDKPYYIIDADTTNDIYYYSLEKKVWNDQTILLVGGNGEEVRLYNLEEGSIDLDRLNLNMFELMSFSGTLKNFGFVLLASKEDWTDDDSYIYDLDEYVSSYLEAVLE